jgi:hypothetical protein
MAKKENKISVNALEKVYKNGEPNEQTYEWADGIEGIEGIEVTIKKVLPLSEVVEFVADLVEACIGEDGTYTPEAYDFMERIDVVTRYANFTLPSDVKKQYDFLYGTNVYSFVLDKVDNLQMYEIRQAADLRIKHELDMDVRHTRSLLKDLVDRFSHIAEGLEDSMSHVTQEDVAKMVSAIGAGAVDEKKIVNAYIDTKRNADPV